MRKLFLLLLATTIAATASAQQVLSLDSCRAMAIRSNKQLSVKRLKQDAARLSRQAARTQYLPKVDAIGGYEYFSREISLLSNSQKNTLSNLGTNAAGSLAASGDLFTQMAMAGQISPQTAKDLGTLLGALGPGLAQYGDELGTGIREAFDTNTHNVWAGAITIRQPIYTGGAISALNAMADIAEEMADNDVEGQLQTIVSQVEETYWLVVSLRQKLKLANAYRDLVKKLDDDVHKLIREGVATYANGLTVDVKVNEADMAITTIDNALSMAKMLLCKQCGLPLETDIALADGDGSALLLTSDLSTTDNAAAYYNRSELRLLQNAVDLSTQTTRLIGAAYRPTVALTGGYMLTNPSAFNGFSNRFAGMWNIGLMVRIPVWNWREGQYKVRASRTATAIAELELSEARQMVDLQIEQCRYKLSQATKRLSVAIGNLKSAEENLRCANVGFREGVMESTEVMAAQTAWQAAQTKKIDAEIDVKMSHVSLKKALGITEF